MHEDDIKALDDWFRRHENYGTYHHTEEKDGEDIYVVGSTHMVSFCNQLSLIPDLIGIPCEIENDCMRFTSEDLKKARFY